MSRWVLSASLSFFLLVLGPRPVAARTSPPPPGPEDRMVLQLLDRLVAGEPVHLPTSRRRFGFFGSHRLVALPRRLAGYRVLRKWEERGAPGNRKFAYRVRVDPAPGTRGPRTYRVHLRLQTTPSPELLLFVDARMVAMYTVRGAREVRCDPAWSRGPDAAGARDDRAGGGPLPGQGPRR